MTHHKPPVVVITPGYAAAGDPACLPGLRDMVRRLAAQRTVIVVALRYPYHKQPYQLDGARVIPLGGGLVTGWKRIAFIARACSTVTQLVTEHRAAIVHAVWADEPGYIAAVVKARTQVATVVSIAGAELADVPDRNFGVQRQCVGPLMVGAALANTDVITCGSPWLGRELQRGFAAKFGGKPQVIVPMGVDTTHFHPEGEREAIGGGLHVIHVASCSPVKGHDILLGAWRRVAHSGLDVTLHLVGAGTDRIGVLPPRTVGHGEIAHQRLPRWLRSADLWVQSSLYESQSVALLEAAAAGVAVLGTRVGMLADCPPAMALVPPGDVGALAQSLITALRDAPRLRACGHAGRTWVSGRYDADTTAALIKTVYQQARAPC